MDANGHGTHVVTILGEAVVGSPIGASEYDGMAPRAKVVFNDIGVGVCAVPLYDGLAREVDEYAWSHRDFLPVFAAGNFGLSAGAPSTVTSPAGRANGVAVGASLGWSGPNVRRALSWGTATMNVRSRITGTVEAFTVYMAAVGADRFVTGAEFRLVAASPPDACSDFTVRFPGAVVLVTRGGCYFSDKIIRAQDAGAVGVIVANDDVTGFFKHGAEDGDASARLVRVPAASVPASSHRKLLAAMPCVVTSDPRAFVSKRVDHIASFSSFGPTTDGRIKPDVVAPGEISGRRRRRRTGAVHRSAEPFPNCAVTTIAGTSMATPVAAGAAAHSPVLYRRFLPHRREDATRRLRAHSGSNKGALDQRSRAQWGSPSSARTPALGATGSRARSRRQIFAPRARSRSDVRGGRAPDRARRGSLALLRSSSRTGNAPESTRLTPPTSSG